MRVTGPIKRLADGSVEHSLAMRSWEVSTVVRTLIGRISGLRGESAALGSCLSLDDGQVTWTAPVREFLRDLNSTLSYAAAPSGERTGFDAAGVLSVKT